MADTTTQGTTAATPTFNLASAQHLLHGAAHLRQNTIHLTQEDYSAFCNVRQTVEDAEKCLRHTHAGLDLLLDLLDNSDVESYVSTAMRGLLGPLALHLEHHSQKLAATIGE